MENRIRRGEIYNVFLDPAFGREIGGYKVRPVAVVSINDIHEQTRMVTVVPGTSTQFTSPIRINIQPSANNGLKNETYFLCHQVRAVDQGRMTGAAIGNLSGADLERIEEGIKISFGLVGDPPLRSD